MVHVSHQLISFSFDLESKAWELVIFNIWKEVRLYTSRYKTKHYTPILPVLQGSKYGPLLPLVIFNLSLTTMANLGVV